MAMPRPEGGTVVKLLCSKASAAARPQVPYASIYSCYCSSERCGPLMRSLWEGARPGLGSAGKQKLHLIAGLATLLTDWLEEARASSTSREALNSFASSVRQLGVAADLDRHIAELDGIGALLGDNMALATSADLLKQQLRRLLRDLSALGQF